MKSENEKILSEIRNRKDVGMSFQRNSIERMLQRIPQNDTRMRQYMFQWLSCETENDRTILKGETYALLSKEEKEAFSMAFHQYLLVAKQFKELSA